MNRPLIGKAFKVHSRWGTESDQAFDLLRLSELHVLQEEWRSARELRERARQMFGGSLATLHIELDEAELALRDGEVRPAGVKVEKALEGFSHIKYAKGISRALHLLGEQAHLDGHVEEAIRYYVAALTVFPYEDSPAHPNTWQWLDQALWQMRFRSDPDALRHEVRLLHEMAGQRTGPFRQLDHTSADRTEALTAILRRLSGVRELGTDRESQDDNPSENSLDTILAPR